MEIENNLFLFGIYCLTIILLIILYLLSNEKPKNILFKILKDLSYLIIFPSEIISIFKILFKKRSKIDLDKSNLIINDIDYCYLTLNKVSRSFSVVIEELPLCLKDNICIFYLILRGLDSVEDDMIYPDKDKINLLKDFHNKLLIDNWSINNIGDKKDYQILLKNFNKIINVFKSLDLKYQKIIIDITQRMGNGMADYVGKNNSIETIQSYNLYCHYVAGLVGHGLSSIFINSGLEDADLDSDNKLSNSMGLFLQKTNIIRDYLEDLHAGRTWWPKEIWINYASNIEDFAKNQNEERSVECLNHMVMDSLYHLPDVINYLSRLKHPKIFQFCSIPQVMAVATLCELYNNPLVFTSVVKIRKGLSCKLMLNSSNLHQVNQWFHFFITKIQQKIPNRNNINNKKMHDLVDQIKILL